MHRTLFVPTVVRRVLLVASQSSDRALDGPGEGVCGWAG